jgi:DNA-binding CsgD family transcriptional regulator
MQESAAGLSQVLPGGSFRFNRSPACQLLVALENSPIGVAICDRRLRIVAVNRSVAIMNNRPVEEHIGRTSHDIIGSLALKAETHLEQVLSSGLPQFNVSLSGQLPTKPTVDHRLVNYFPIKGGGGRVMQVGAFVIDQSMLRTRLDQKRELCGYAMSASRLRPPPANAVEQATLPKASFPANTDQHDLLPLSPRETDVLRLLAEGKSSKEASSILLISVKTVEEYRVRLKFKLNATSLADLIHYAIRHHVVALRDQSLEDPVYAIR